jgi:hypothetical protein
MATDRPWAGSNLTRFLMTAEVCFRVCRSRNPSLATRASDCHRMHEALE